MGKTIINKSKKNSRNPKGWILKSVFTNLRFSLKTRENPIFLGHAIYITKILPSEVK